MTEIKELYRLEGVTFSIKGRRLLDIESLSIGEGGICCLAGPNGAGKTLFLSLLAGLNRPESGAVMYRGRAMDGGFRDAVMGREATMMLQHPFLFRGSVIANVVYGIRDTALSRRERVRRGEALLERVGLAGFSRRKSGELSAGEKARVALARALACGARTFLLDEPTASVDREGVALMEEILSEEAAGKGHTVIMSTHSRAQAERLGGRLLRLREGRVVLPATRSASAVLSPGPEGAPPVPVPTGSRLSHRHP